MYGRKKVEVIDMNYAQKQATARQAYLEIGMEVGMQKMADFFAIALNDPAVLGKSVLGKKRLMPVLQRVHDLIDEFSVAFTVQDDADYMQDKLDRLLRQIYGDSEFVPFEERYPAIKQRKYK